LVWLGTRVARAATTLKTAVERGMNWGLTDEEDKKAAATLADIKKPIAERQAAAATLRRKFDAAVAGGAATVPAVVAAGKALDIMDRTLREEADLEVRRQAWQKSQLKAVPKS
jgi:hypothetical protein